MTSTLSPNRIGSSSRHPRQQVSQPWVAIPSGGDGWRAYEQFTPAVWPSGAQTCLYAVMTHGGIVAIVAVATAVGASATAMAAPPAYNPQRAQVAVPMPRKRDDSRVQSDSSPDSERPALTPEEQLDAIQDSLSLSVSQIAEVLHVTRPTVYAWSRGSVSVPKDRADAQRLRALHRVANAWRKRSEYDVGRWLTVPVGDDEPSLLDLLKADQWDEQALARTMDVLARRLAERASERQVRRDETPAGELSVEATAIERERLRALSRRVRHRRR
jgi:DNA-binding transcriptional regulator YiaG